VPLWRNGRTLFKGRPYPIDDARARSLAKEGRMGVALLPYCRDVKRRESRTDGDYDVACGVCDGCHAARRELAIL
jgi:hypothetical protein